MASSSRVCSGRSEPYRLRVDFSERNARLLELARACEEFDVEMAHLEVGDYLIDAGATKQISRIPTGWRTETEALAPAAELARPARKAPARRDSAGLGHNRRRWARQLPCPLQRAGVRVGQH